MMMTPTPTVDLDLDRLESTATEAEGCAAFGWTTHPKISDFERTFNPATALALISALRASEAKAAVHDRAIANGWQEMDHMARATTAEALAKEQAEAIAGLRDALEAIVAVYAMNNAEPVELRDALRHQIVGAAAALRTRPFGGDGVGGVG